jgi:preprotein translocase subunit SecE
VGEFLQELFQTNLYKRSQGRVVRQVTFAVIALIIALGCWALSFDLQDSSNRALRYGLPLALLLAGGWAAFRLIHLPQFADFLISVEAEMNKVAWPKRRELINASIVVMILIFALAFMLFGFDLFLQWIQTAFRWVVNAIAEGLGTTEGPVE